MSSTTGPSKDTATEQKPAAVASALAWLKAEQNAADTPSYSSLLLHESGAILEGNGEDEEAARDYRAALSFEPDYRESLERLLALSERHRRFDELGTLYEQLTQAADSVDERARALLERAFYLAVHRNDAAGALRLLDEVIADSPRNASAWLLYDLLSDRLGDGTARERALAARLESVLHPQYRGLLLLEWAELRHGAKDTDRALALLDQAISEASNLTYAALSNKERVSLVARRTAIYSTTLAQRIRLVERSIVDAEAGNALGVPLHDRNPRVLGALRVLLSLVYTEQGDTDAAAELLTQARSNLPEDRLADYVAFAQAERFEQWEQFTTLGEQLARAEQGSLAAWLWLRLAMRRSELGDAAGARRFVSAGLEIAPSSLALRVFDVHLAIQKDDGLHLATSLEAATDCFETEQEKSEWLLAAAGIWALLVRDGTAAKAAVSQATQHGLSAATAQQASRVLASFCNDLNWYVEATQGARRQSTDPVERLDLLLEILRARLACRDDAAALASISELAQDNDSALLSNLFDATLGRCLRARLGSTDNTADGEHEPARTPAEKPVALAWSRLADSLTSVDHQHALRIGAVVDSLLANDLEQASLDLCALREAEPSDVMVSAAQAAVAQRLGRVELATSILREAAEHEQDPGLKSTIALEGALLGIRTGTPQQVVASLDLAAEHHPEAAAALARWALRPIADRDPLLTDRLRAAAHDFGSPVRRALEGCGWSLLSGNWEPPLEPLLELASADAERTARAAQNVPCASSEPLRLAVRLAQAVATAGETNELDPPALIAARVAADHFESAAGSPEDRLGTARMWADAEPSLVAQLEWYLACQRANASAEEAEARDRLAQRLPAKDAEPLRVSAHLQRFVSQVPQLPLLPSTSAGARLANLEISLPGCDPRRRATAIEEAGELLGNATTSALGACLALNQLATGDTDKARVTLKQLVDTDPRFLPAWLVLRLLAEHVQDEPLLARASAALGDLLSDPKEAAAEWERAATLLLDKLSDQGRGVSALRKAVELDVTRDQAFQRLFRIVRESRDAPSLLALIEARLPHAKTDDERLTLLWERARTLRGVSDREGALAALDAVSAINPNHVGALALAGEINIALGKYDDAARFLSQLARQADAPAKQRLLGGIAAADLFDKKLKRPSFAKDILLQLHREGHSTEPLRERLASLAMRTHAHPLALEMLELLMHERASSSGRAEAARLALVLHRDHLLDPARADSAVERLLQELPGDPEALDLVLTDCFDRAQSQLWLRDAEALLRSSLLAQPMDAPSWARLAQIAEFFDDRSTRQLALGALLSLGCGTQEMDDELAQLERQGASMPAMVIEDPALQELCDPADTGPIVSLFQNFAGVFAESLGPTLAVLGVGKKQRVDPRAGLPLRNELVAWAGAFGIREFDLYLSERVPGDVIAIPSERPSIVISVSLTAPLDAHGRQAVARELFLLRRGTSILRHRSPTEVRALVLASCQVGGHPLSAPPYAMQEEFVRAISSELPRRLRKLLVDLSESIRSVHQTDTSVGEWVSAALTSQDRAAALATSDVSHVLSYLTGQRGRPPETHDLIERMTRLLSFALSPRYLVLKHKLGLAVR